MRSFNHKITVVKNTILDESISIARRGKSCQNLDSSVSVFFLSLF